MKQQKIGSLAHASWMGTLTPNVSSSAPSAGCAASFVLLAGTGTPSDPVPGAEAVWGITGMSAARQAAPENRAL
jgi:hypothetical protein